MRWSSVSNRMSIFTCSVLRFSYDADGRNIGTQFATGVVFTSTLDQVGNRLAQQDNFGITSWTYDANSQLVGLQAPPAVVFGSALPVNASFVRDALGREIQKQVNLLGATVSTTYDPAGRVTSVNTDAPFAPSFSYQYNAVNNRVGAIESGGSNVSYAYDAISQLVSEIRTGTNPYSISYSFDALGNRVSENNGGVTTARTFNAANSMLTAVPSVGASTSRSYDACGHLTLSNTGGALTTLVWDSENRLTICTQPSLAESYSYHASLKRMFMKSNFYRASLGG